MDRVTVQGSSPRKDYIIPRKGSVLRRISIRSAINGLDLKRFHVVSMIGGRRATNDARRLICDLTLLLVVLMQNFVANNLVDIGEHRRRTPAQRLVETSPTLVFGPFLLQGALTT